VAEPGTPPSPPIWRWCPSCRLASAKDGVCPGCGCPYLAVPAQGVPGEPYRPRVPRTGAGLSGLISVVLVLAVLGGCAVGVWALYRNGDNITAAGQLVPANAASGSTKASSPYPVAAFDDATLLLPGAWTTDGDQYGNELANEVSEVGGPVSVQLSVEQADAALAIVSVATSDAGDSTTELLGLLSSQSSDGSGGTVTWAQTRDLTIATYPTVAQDFADYSSTKALEAKGTVYCVDDTAQGQLVVIAADTRGSAAGELSGIEKALTSMA
jgi:hypothetical protein